MDSDRARSPAFNARLLNGVTRQAKGQWAERQALEYLIAQGLTYVAKNVRYRCGEIDLIMSDRNTLVFVEVRLRSNPRYGSAAASVGPEKKKRLLRAACLWLRSTAPDPPQCRFDVVALSPLEAEPLRWLRGVF